MSRFAIPLLALATMTTAGASAAVAAPQDGGGKPDTLFWLRPSTGATQAVNCVVLEEGLGNVKVRKRDGSEDTFKSEQVVTISWGAVPSSFSDGETYASRSDWENAVQSFQEAASDSDARGPVQAAARFRAIECLIGWGAADPAHFTDAVTEADRFLSDHAENRRMPEARALKARALWLSGDAAAARDGYKALHDAGKGGTEGYAPMLVAQAALQGAHAAISAGDSAGATELFDLASRAFGAVEPRTEAETAEQAAGTEVCGLGPALSKLARGDHSGAARDLERAVDGAQTSAAKGTARLGLGLALLGDGKHREAQLELAWVAGLDHTSADRRAAALVGYAQATIGADPDGGAVAAKAALERVKAEFGTTPAAAKAAELLKSL